MLTRRKNARDEAEIIEYYRLRNIDFLEKIKRKNINTTSSKANEGAAGFEKADND